MRVLVHKNSACFPRGCRDERIDQRESMGRGLPQLPRQLCRCAIHGKADRQFVQVRVRGFRGFPIIRDLLMKPSLQFRYRDRGDGEPERLIRPELFNNLGARLVEVMGEERGCVQHV